MASLKVSWGPALIAWKRWPSSVKSTTFTEPDGPLGESLSSSSLGTTRALGRLVAHALTMKRDAVRVQPRMRVQAGRLARRRRSLTLRSFER